MSGTGVDYPPGSLVETQDDNEDKNHNRQNDLLATVTAAQPGMILSEGLDDTLWHKINAALNIILQAELVVVMDGEVMTMDGEVMTY